MVLLFWSSTCAACVCCVQGSPGHYVSMSRKTVKATHVRATIKKCFQAVKIHSSCSGSAGWYSPCRCRSILLGWRVPKPFIWTVCNAILRLYGLTSTTLWIFFFLFCKRPPLLRVTSISTVLYENSITISTNDVWHIRFVEKELLKSNAVV